MQEPFEEVPAVNDFVRYRLGWFMLVVGLFLAAGLVVGLTESQFGSSLIGSHGTLRNATLPNGIPAEAAKQPAPSVVATTGTTAAPAAVIREIESLTGTRDAQALIGRDVDLTVPVLGRANDQAFWVGEGDNQMLVVVRRDNRDAAQRYYGAPAQHHVGEVQAGGQATITGQVEPIPEREEMYSWGLTQDDIRQLEERPIYIAATSVQAAGQ